MLSAYDLLKGDFKDLADNVGAPKELLLPCSDTDTANSRG